MTLFSWYLTPKQHPSKKNVIDKSLHIEGMWPIAKVRQNTLIQHKLIGNKQPNIAFNPHDARD